MRILITGSEGVLGVPLREELEKRGHEVYGCDLMHTESPQYIRADIRDMRQVENAFTFSQPQVVYNLAAEFGRNNGEDYYEQLWSTNQIGNENVIRACLAYDSIFILAGSSEAYGESGADWLKESDLDFYKPNFHNNYALSKWVQEQQTFLAAKNHNLEAIVLRFFNSYGPGELYSPYRSVICLFIYRLMHGMPITVYRNYHRVFQYVTDWSATVANVAERFNQIPQREGVFHTTPVFNIGGDEYRSVEELAQLIINKLVADYGYDRKKLNALVTYRDKEVANVTNKRPDNRNAATQLGHDPTITLEVGLDKTIAWMNEVYHPVEGVKLAA